MKKATILSIINEPSDSIEKQGKRSDIERYLMAGYYIKENRNGYWVLVKVAKLHVTLNNSFGTKTYNMKEAICDYYKKGRISEKLADKFKQDVKDEKISLYMNAEGCYFIK
jgi:hypothetical protein